MEELKSLEPSDETTHQTCSCQSCSTFSEPKRKNVIESQSLATSWWWVCSARPGCQSVHVIVQVIFFLEHFDCRAGQQRLITWGWREIDPQPNFYCYTPYDGRKAANNRCGSGTKKSRVSKSASFPLPEHIAEERSGADVHCSPFLGYSQICLGRTQGCCSAAARGGGQH